MSTAMSVAALVGPEGDVMRVTLQVLPHGYNGGPDPGGFHFYVDHDDGDQLPVLQITLSADQAAKLAGLLGGCA